MLELSFNFAPFRLSGTVYGVLLNHRSALAALGPKVSLPPYQAAPKAPVLYVKPRNTLNVSGATVLIPRGTDELEVGASLGLVIGRAACNVKQSDALDYIAGYLAVNDVSIPHANYYRPSIRYKAHDGFCPLGPAAARAALERPEAVDIRVRVDGRLMQSSSTRDLIRPVACLLADVTEFMTLVPGDVLAIGVAAGAPRVHAGQSASIEIDGLDVLNSSFIAAEG